MRFLILSFSYAPRTNPRATRWTTLAEEFVQSGHSVRVVTSWQPGSPTQETLRGVEVHRVGMRVLERLRLTLSASKPVNDGKTAAESAATARPDGLVRRIMKLLNRYIWRNLWWPDSACVWLLPALKSARRLLGEHPADVVISVSPAFSAVVAGHFLTGNRKQCGRWIIDLGDPFSFMEQAAPNNDFFYGCFNRWFEKRTFLHADGISVTTDGTREMYNRLYPECAGKITVIPPLLSPLPAPAPQGLFASNDGTTRLVFIGTLYRNLRRPDYLLRLFSAMLDLRPEFDCQLHLIGDTHECREILAAYKQMLGHRLAVHAPVNRNIAARAMRDADVLVNLGNETAFQLPSKLVEYAATGKRIVNISSLATDSSTVFLTDYPQALCLQDQGAAPSAEQVLAFSAFCENRGCQEIDASVLSALLQPFTLKIVSQRYSQLFESPLQR